MYGGATTDYFTGCQYNSSTTNTNVLLNAANDNYYLVPNCTAAKMSFTGKYVGKFTEGYAGDVSGTWTLSNVDTSGNIIDQRKLATLTSPILSLGKVQKIISFEDISKLAIRNGNEINRQLTIIPTPLIYTNTLTLGKIYKVYNSVITTTGSSTSTNYSIGDCFIAKNDTSHSLTFTSGTDTYSSSISAGTTLTDLALYEVEAGASVTYKGVTYNTGERFQAYIDLTVDPTSNVFSGSGTVKRFNGGFVRQIYDYLGTSGIAAGTTLRDRTSYLVVGGTSITYGGTVYNTGKVFTCDTSLATTFTSVGGATLTEYYIGFVQSIGFKSSKVDPTLSGLSFKQFSLYDTPQCNYDGGGAVTYGNADSSFSRSTAQDLYALYYQYEILIQGINIT